MNYLQLALGNAQHGNQAFMNHLGFCVGQEQSRIISAISKRKFWFVDIPRTSSTSIQLSLGNDFGFPFGKSDIPGQSQLIQGTSSCLLPPHTLAIHLQNLVGAKLWASVQSFSVVRNPYTWSISLWGYTRKFNDLGLDNTSFKNFLLSFRTRLAGPRQSRPFFPSSYMQSDYLTDDAGKIIVRDVLRFEDRPNIDHYLRQLGVKTTMEEKLVTSDSRGYDMSGDEKKLVHEIFARDFDQFGY